VTPTSSGHIELTRVWKKFRYGEVHSRLRDVIPALVGRMFGRADPDEGLWKGEFWAVRDVSFSVRPGEAVGLIGPNGAGKSTILKLLTGIMRPTAGVCAVRGRVGALIELTAGFHPDLTGRENVFLQGVIMGMPRREIARKFDEIIAFAGVELFLDTPVKRYSNGMQARLGFAIAAHLEPDVLLIDEALAVGDASFQAKAFERVAQLVRQDIPVVVVSHQLDAISTLCNHALLLNRGRVVCDGTPAECIAAYLHGRAGVLPPAAGDGAVRIESLRLPGEVVTSGEVLVVELGCSIREDGWSEPESVRVRVRFAQTGETVFESGTHQLGVTLPNAGWFVTTFDLQFNVPPGVFVVETSVWDRQMSRESFVGPTRYIEVRGGAPFDGMVQMNPRVQVRAQAPAGIPGGR
jgi:ABC-type polysaccharide/polyol phosphate transport system ATPase subunit